MRSPRQKTAWLILLLVTLALAPAALAADNDDCLGCHADVD